MTFGLSAQNTSGLVQIDNIYRNYAVLATGTISANTYYTRPSSHAQAILLVSCADPAINFCVFYGSSTTWRIITENETAASFKYVCLLPSNLITEDSSTHGLRIFDANGAVVFSSRLTYMNIVTNWVVTGLQPNDSWQTLSLASSVKTRYITIEPTAPVAIVPRVPGSGAYVSPFLNFQSNHSIRVRSLASWIAGPSTGLFTSPRYFMIGEFWL